MTDGQQVNSRDTIHSFDHFLAIHHQPADGTFLASPPTTVHSFTFPLSKRKLKTTTTYSVSLGLAAQRPHLPSPNEAHRSGVDNKIRPTRHVEHSTHIYKDVET